MYVDQTVSIPTTSPFATDPAYIAALHPSQPNPSDTVVTVDYVAMTVPLAITTPVAVPVDVDGSGTGTVQAGCDGSGTTAAVDSSTFVGQVALELMRRLNDTIAAQGGAPSNFSIDGVACTSGSSGRRLLQTAGSCDAPPLQLQLVIRMPPSEDLSLFRSRVASTIEAWKNETAARGSALSMCTTLAETVQGSVLVSTTA